MEEDHPGSPGKLKRRSQKMANIDTYLQQIMAAIYGEDVRGSIHDAIEAINDQVDAAEETMEQFVQGAMDTTLTSTTKPAQGKAVGYAVSDIKSALHTEYLYAEKALSNSRWPRIILPVTSGDNYFINIQAIKKYGTVDRIFISQGESVLVDNMSENTVYLFTPSGNDPVYLNIRHTTEPAETPSVIFWLYPSGVNMRSVTRSDILISNTNKNAICNGTCDDLPINIISGVNTNATLINSPFTGEYYEIISFGKFSSRTSGDFQVAISGNNNIIKTRIYYSGSWSEWLEITDQRTVEKISGIFNFLNSANDQYCFEAASNSRWPRITLPVESGTTYAIKVYKIDSLDEVSKCYVNQGSSQIATDLTNHAPKIFTPSGSDPVYLTVQYAAEPQALPVVAFELYEIGKYKKALSSSELLITEDNKADICGGDCDNLPGNIIIAVNSQATLLHCPFLGIFYSIITFSKYFSRTSGDFQVAISADNNTIKTRIYSGSWSKWKTNINVSRYPGMKFSIIGDSISTFNQEGYKIDGYRMAYPYLDVKNVENTWWMRVIDASDAALEVNASWSGSCATNVKAPSGYLDFYDRCDVLGNPDTIFIELGTNDSLSSAPLGEFDFESTYTELSESTFRTAYIKGIKALKNNYPLASIICIILSMNDAYANSIKTIANELDCKIIECRDYKIADSSVHPGILGMRQISSRVLYPEN